MSGVTALIVVLPFLYSLIAAQAGEHSPDGPVARLSYSSTYGVDWREQKNSPRICFALYRSGRYRILRRRNKEPKRFREPYRKTNLPVSEECSSGSILKANRLGSFGRAQNRLSRKLVAGVRTSISYGSILTTSVPPRIQPRKLSTGYRRLRR